MCQPRTLLLAQAMSLLLLGSIPTLAQSPTRPLRPDEYGTIIMDSASEEAGFEPAIFEHWRHRALYTCRLCHVDLGFAMIANGTGVTEQDNRDGFFCGACHDGKEAFGYAPGDTLTEGTNCTRCHTSGREYRAQFMEFQRTLPRSAMGNRIDWLTSESKGMVKPKDFLKGHSIKRPALERPAEIELKPTLDLMPEIIFSHEKHAIWSGCELCHPTIFAVRRDESAYSMQDIFDGRYCGVCHGKVAFPNNDCRLCHTKDV